MKRLLLLVCVLVHPVAFIVGCGFGVIIAAFIGLCQALKARTARRRSRASMILAFNKDAILARRAGVSVKALRHLRDMRRAA